MVSLPLATSFSSDRKTDECVTVASWFNTTPVNSPSQDNFLIFVSVWTAFLAVPYLALSPRLYPRAAHKFAILAVEAVTMLFWFAAFIAAAVFVSRLRLCKGSACGALKAAVVFGAFEWYVNSTLGLLSIMLTFATHRILFAATTVFATIYVLRNRTNTSTSKSNDLQYQTQV